MIFRALVVWLLILGCAVANGGIRDMMLVPRLGETVSHAISSVALAAIVLLISRWTINWLAPPSRDSARWIGVGWLLLTLVFEFLAGHYVMHRPWDELLLDYNVVRGRIWALVLIATALGPAIAYSARHD